jgi:cardiolipin synthase
MRIQNRTTGRLILTLVIIQVLSFIPGATCLADEEAAAHPENIRTASLYIPELVVLPRYRELSQTMLEVPAKPTGKRSGGPGRIHAALHLVGSHLGIVTRPVSAVTKLVSMLFFTGQDAVRNTLLQKMDPVTPPRLNTGPEMDLTLWEKDLDEITGTRLSSGRIRLLIDGEEFYSRLTQSFLDAAKSIHIRIYIYDNDDYAMEIAKLLKERSRDVDVRILADGLGTIMANGVHPDSVPEDHQPLVSIKDHFTSDSKVRMRLQKNLWLTLDHTKTILVDRKTAFIGGMNIGREYRYDWHDLMMEVDGPVVNTLQDEFNLAWAYAGFLGDFARAFTRRGSKGADVREDGYPIRVLFTRTADSQIYRAQLAAIKRSRKYIYIQNPYISDDAMLQELVKARRRGVDVRVIIPRKGNWKVMDRSNKLAANTMLAGGIKVYLYPVMSHVKAAIFDGWACVGSANFDKASFRTNQEMNLATSNPEAVRDLKERLFYPDFERSTLMTEPNPEKWSDHVYEIIADQM